MNFKFPDGDSVTPENIQKSEIEYFLNRWNVSQYEIHTNVNTYQYIVDIHQSCKTLGHFKYFPFKIRHIDGNFDCTHTGLKSLINGPEYVNGYFDCNTNDLTTLEHMPKKIVGAFSCTDNPIVTYKNIHKMCDQIGGSINSKLTPIYIPLTTNAFIDQMVSESSLIPIDGLLYWTLIKGLHTFRCILVKNNEYSVMSDILTQNALTNDILSAQEQLMDRGLHQWATL